MTAFTGRQQPLPTWVDNGAVLGLEGGTTAVSAVVNKTIAAAGDNPPVAAVWLQDWTGERNFSGPGELPRVGLWWNWEVDETHYPGWVDFISDLDSRDVKVLVYLCVVFLFLWCCGVGAVLLTRDVETGTRC